MCTGINEWFSRCWRGALWRAPTTPPRAPPRPSRGAPRPATAHGLLAHSRARSRGRASPEGAARNCGGQRSAGSGRLTRCARCDNSARWGWAQQRAAASPWRRGGGDAELAERAGRRGRGPIGRGESGG
eukprot:1594052-Pyramimonas_sp.AAC.1